MRIFLIVAATWLLMACGGDSRAPEPTATGTSEANTVALDTERDAPPPPTPTAASESEKGDAGPSIAEESDIESLVGQRTLTIDPQQSEARFLVNEVLLGEDKTVVGVTSEVSGTISVDPADPESVTISAITIDAADLTTDSSRRNRSIQRQILRSALDENRYITFLPTAITGLPDRISIDLPFAFTITGDLTVRGETRPVTFEMKITPSSATELAGIGTTVIRYEDFGISIPSVPAVASVEDEVRLEFEFVATVVE